MKKGGERMNVDSGKLASRGPRKRRSKVKFIGRLMKVKMGPVFQDAREE